MNTLITQKKKHKMYGEDLKFVRIYEMIKMRAPISAEDYDYYLAEKDFYNL